MEKISPSICLGAIEAIDFLLENYGSQITDSYNLNSLKNAKKSFEDAYEKFKQIQEPEEIIIRNKKYSKEKTMSAYGKLFVSKEIENDSLFIEELKKGIEIKAKPKPENLEYNTGYAFALRSVKLQLKKIVDKVLDSEKANKIESAIYDVEYFYQQIAQKLVSLNLQEIKQKVNTYNGLLGMLDAYTFCNNNYGEIISDDYDFGVNKTTEKIENINYYK